MGHWVTFFKKSFVLGYYNVLIQVTSLLIFTIVARFLNAEEYGLIALITVFSGFLIIFSDSGLSYAVVREDFDNFFLRKLATLSLIIGISLTCILTLLAYPISVFYENPALFFPTAFLSVVFSINAVFLIPKACLQKRMEFNKVGLYMFIGQFVNGCIAILLAFYGFSYWALVFAPIFGALIQGVFFLYTVRVYPVIISLNEIKLTFLEVKSLIGNISSYNMVNYWARNADNLLIGKYFGQEPLGIYNYAYKLFYLPNNILNNVLSQLVLPSFKNLKESNGNIEKEYMRLLGLLSILLIPIASVFILFSKNLVLFLFGNQWISIKDILPFFGVAILTQPLVSPISILLVLYKKELELTKIGMINSLILVSFIVLGIMFSVKHLVLFYTLSYLLLTLPVIVLYGLNKVLEFGIGSLISFWIPKLLLSLVIVLGLWYDYGPAKYIGMFFYIIFVFISERKNINDFVILLKKKNIF